MSHVNGILQKYNIQDTHYKELHGILRWLSTCPSSVHQVPFFPPAGYRYTPGYITTLTQRKYAHAHVRSSRLPAARQCSTYHHRYDNTVRTYHGANLAAAPPLTFLVI